MDAHTGELAFLPLGGTGEIGMTDATARTWPSIAASASAAMNCLKPM
jgi:hypothetical protein